MRPHHSGETQTTDALKIPATRRELSSNIDTLIMLGNYENTESTKALNMFDSDEVSSPVIESSGLLGEQIPNAKGSSV